MREGEERRGREEREEGERRGKKKGKEREGGTDPFITFSTTKFIRNKFLCKNISVLIEREKRINKSLTG